MNLHTYSLFLPHNSKVPTPNSTISKLIQCKPNCGCDKGWTELMGTKVICTKCNSHDTITAYWNSVDVYIKDNLFRK